ncbi:hypothetical protein ORI89_04060 [Sphingobacterium sp. UT-1RO-CII-1]|uniref:hypothetical protein n=1 Tax=Sphingobacterium sp. UT-1RO-CII-1 TaxID=2995225 RepID=UPI00227C8D9F|nr:hypothetical protein [Sphingobacterium sp. UT-1RO-CII-1]MCY4778814.1 hypothetical protein [Sphingobacterium sp. UT-1RO-CII-1]
MDREANDNYNKTISERLLLILEYSQLEIKGIAVLTEKSIDIFYAVLSLRKPLSKDLANSIGKALDFDGSVIFNLNIKIPSSIRESTTLSQFKKENINNKQYFSDLWSKNKDSEFIKTNLIYKGYFSEPRYTWEISEALIELDRDIDPDLLKSYLKYFVKKDILKSKVAPIKKKNGEYGTRKVNIYYL